MNNALRFAVADLNHLLTWHPVEDVEVPLPIVEAAVALPVTMANRRAAAPTPTTPTTATRSRQASSAKFVARRGILLFVATRGMTNASKAVPPQQKSASNVTSSYGVDTNWYMDSGATAHIASDLDKLSFRDKYHGGEYVHTANGSGMEISHVGHGFVHSPSHKIHLRNILHVPNASKSLVSVNCLSRDNNAFVEFHPDRFFIKELATKKTLLTGKAEGGLYPLKPTSNRSSPSNKQALGATKPSSFTWHSRLGHASAPFIRHILSSHELPFIRDVNNNLVCDACQQGKSHQLPFPKSISVSTSA
jgi:hypothetical protein